VCSGLRRFHQGLPKMWVAMARAATLSLASTLVIPRAQSSPRSKVRSAWVLVHVSSGLSQHLFGYASPDAWDLIDGLDRLIKRAHPLLNLSVESLYLLIKESNVL
jgi:hypothetical protein